MSQLSDITKRKEAAEDLHSRHLATLIQAAQDIVPETCAAILESYKTMNQLRREELQIIADGKLSASSAETHLENPPETASDAPGPLAAVVTTPNTHDA